MKVELRPHQLPRDYRIVTIVELKRDNDDIVKAQSQMSDYMTRIDEICTPGNDFKGFLVMESQVLVFGYSGHGEYRRVEVVDSYSMFDAGNPWSWDLANIAVRSWN